MEQPLSPRNSIQKWLENQERKCGHARRDLPNNDTSVDFQYQKQGHISSGVQRDYGTNRKQQLRNYNTSQRSATYGQDTREWRRLSCPREADHESRLAERLDLHAPFRHMEAKGLQGDDQLKVAVSRNKRKRASSSSSYLGPAIADAHTAYQHDRGGHSPDGDAKVRGDKRGLTILASAISDASMSQVASSPAKPSKSYERRARHKTKEDRYELKHGVTNVQAPKERKTMKSTRPSRKEKTGAALLHNFAADNVSSDRLTLRPGTSLGLFTKGRASSPYRRGGLPDLSFSEINFLSTHRDKPPVPKRDSDHSKRHREHNTLENDDEISRFFAVTKASLTERDLNSYNNSGYAFPLPPIRSPSRKLHRYSTATNSTTPAKAPIRPFLGFGERGPQPPVSPGPSSNYKASMSPAKQLLRQSPSIATSYFPWSTSPNNQRSSPHKRTVSDLFKSSPGKADREKCQIPELPVLHHAGHRKIERPHKRIRTPIHEANTSVADTLSDIQNVEESVQLDNHNHQDQNASPHNEDVTIAELPNIAPKAQVVDFVHSAQPTELSTNHVLPMNNSMSNQEKSVETTSPKEQTPQLQFAIAVQELLDQWKDKIKIPITFADGLQKPYTATSLGMNTADNLSTFQPVPQTTDIQPESIFEDHPQVIEDVDFKKVPIPSPITIVDNHCSVEAPKIVRPTSVVSRGSAAKSQYSWTDPRKTRDRASAYSPFQDSSYSTCRGTESLYEQQLPWSASHSHRHLLNNRANERLDFANHFIGEDSMSQDLVPLEHPTHSQLVDAKLDDPHHVRESVFSPSFPGTPGNYWASVERDWPSGFETQCDATIGPASRDYYGDHEHSAIPAFLAPLLSSATLLSSIQGCADELGSLNPPTRGSQLNGECATMQNAQCGEVDALPVGFWKPNKLY
ncbi:hypothetical protein MMC26_003005 [Xylographa opegraphella]|nr:hypothetical protein [Xylographa opegraphella]